MAGPMDLGNIIEKLKKKEKYTIFILLKMRYLMLLNILNQKKPKLL